MFLSNLIIVRFINIRIIEAAKNSQRDLFMQVVHPEGGSHKATLVVVVVLLLVISSLKISNAYLIRSGAQRSFAYTFLLTFPTDCRLRFSTYFLISD